MNTRTKRWLSLLVAVSLVLAVVPAGSIPPLQAQAAGQPELLLDAEGMGSCPVCNQTVQWTEFDGTRNYTGITTHQHFYLAEDVAYSRDTISVNMLTIAANGKVCFHLNGYTLTTGGRIWLTAENSVLNLMTENGGIDYSVRNDIPGCIQQNFGSLNIYGGTYTKAVGETKPFVSLNRPAMLQDATVNGQILVNNNYATLTLKGATTVTDGIAVNAGKLTADSSFTGAAQLTLAEGMLEGNAVCEANGAATGSFTGSLTLPTGEKLIHKDGRLIIDRNELQLDTNSMGMCPACNETVQWTAYIGTEGVTVANAHRHYYLAQDVDYSESLTTNMMKINDGGQVCFHLNGYTLTTHGRFWLSANDESPVLNLMGATGRLVYTGASSAGCCIQNNKGVVNVYGGTYTVAEGNTKPIMDVSRTATVTDAVVDGEIQAGSLNSKVILAGAAVVNKINLTDNRDGTNCGVRITEGWFGSAELVVTDTMREGTTALKAANGAATGYFPGRLTLSTGEDLVHLGGSLVVKTSELMLDSNGSGDCPVCGQTVQWTAFDGTTNHTGITDHRHFYLADDVTYNRDAVSVNMLQISAGGTVCFHLNGHILTTGGRLWLSAESSTLNLMTENGGIVYSVRNDVPGCIQQNMGPVNVYGGTYTAATGETKPFINANRPVLLQDATVNGFVNVAGQYAGVTLKGDTTITDGIVFAAAGIIDVDSDWTGYAQLTLAEGMLENDAIKSANGTATGEFTGTLLLSTGDQLVYRNGLLVVDGAFTQGVAQPLTWEQINAIPLASNDMTEAELRQICVDFMTLMMRFAWTPSQETDLINRGQVVKTFQTGKVYGGTPYVTGSMGNIYTVMEYYNEETGELDLSGGMDTIRQFANQCSGSTFWAWNRVCNSARYTNTADIVERNGCLRVGPYTYDDNLTDFITDDMPTTTICANNGTQTMYESYALMKPADGVVTVYSANSHVRMISGMPNVVRNADGTIDGAKSTVTYVDQDGVYTSDIQSNGVPYEYVGGYYTQISFAQLFTEGYIPFTFAELNKQAPVVQSQTALNYTAASVTVEQLAAAVVESNYSISDVTYVVKDASNNQVYRRQFATCNIIGIQLRQLRLSLYAIDTAELAAFADGNHTVEVSVRIGTGEKPVVYTGTLMG